MFFSVSILLIINYEPFLLNQVYEEYYKDILQLLLSKANKNGSKN